MTVYRLNEFIRDVTAALPKCRTDMERIGTVQPMLARLLRNKAALEPGLKAPLKDSYAQYLVHKPDDNSLSIVSFVWLPGQSTPIHDHTTWGLIGVFEGEEEEERFARLDDGSRKDYADLRSMGCHVSRAGDVSYVCPPGKEIHQVRNNSSSLSISIHVYGCDIGERERHVFDDRAHTVTPFKSGYTPQAGGRPS